MWPYLQHYKHRVDRFENEHILREISDDRPFPISDEYPWQSQRSTFYNQYDSVGSRPSLWQIPSQVTNLTVSALSNS